MWHKYWWKAYIDTATDDGQNVAQEVKDNPLQQHFIDNLFGSTSLGNTIDGSAVATTPTSTGNPLALDKETLLQLKQDVLFTPAEVDQCVKDVTNDPGYFPCGDLIGKW
jgi:hypothetical protein